MVGKDFCLFVLLFISLLFYGPGLCFEGAGGRSTPVQQVGKRHTTTNTRLWLTSSSPNVSTKNTQRVKAKLESTEINDLDYMQDLIRIGLWFAGSTTFCGLLGHFRGANSAIEFASGYFLEQALSIDNLFVFILLFKYFKVPKRYEPKILRYGIIGALVLRGTFILLGAAVLQRFHCVLLLFAVLLGTASYGILCPPSDAGEQDFTENAVLKFTQKYFKTTDKIVDDSFFVVENGEPLATPLFLCLISIELSDIVFAFDSVPAIFGITEDPLVVYTSNMFSIASLRALYGFLSKAVKGAEYLEKSVGIILALISLKLCFSTFGIEILTPVQSLIIVLIVLGGGALLSALHADRGRR